jgi:peptidoglycan-associated lipoprotein
MKRSATVLGIVMLIFCVSFVFMTGCAKKAISKDEGLREQKSGVAQATTEVKPAPPVPVAPPSGDMKELALRQDAAAAAEAKEKAGKSQFEDIRFAFDKASIEPEARQTLKKIADWMLKNKKYSLVIEGNCDERGTVEYNLALGQRRADAAMKYLVDLGVEKARIATVSYGKERPLDPGHDEEAWAKNRRDNFIVKLNK